MHFVSITPGDETTEYHRHYYEVRWTAPLWTPVCCSVYSLLLADPDELPACRPQEWLSILSGKGEAVIGEETLEVGPGSARPSPLHIPGGACCREAGVAAEALAPGGGR